MLMIPMIFTAKVEVPLSVMVFKLQLIRGHHAPSHDVVPEDLNLPDLFDLKGRWHGSLDASGGGNGDTLVKTYYCLHYYYLELA
jgi:hypothetical protein